MLAQRYLREIKSPIDIIIAHLMIAIALILNNATLAMWSTL